MTMKQLLATTLLVLAPAASAAEEITVTVKGMVCAFCAQGIKKTFDAIPAVERTEPDLEHKTVIIRTKEGAAFPDAEIAKLIGEAGYDVVKIERR